MNTFKKAITVTACATPSPNHRRLTLLLVLLTAQVLPTMALAQASRLNASWPAFDYDGKPAQADGSYSKAIVAGSQIETAGYTAETRTMTAADGRLQVRLDGKNYKGFPAEEYAVVLANLSKTEPTGIAANFHGLFIWSGA